MRRLDAALSSDPLKTFDSAENLSGSRTKSAVEKARASLRCSWLPQSFTFNLKDYIKYLLLLFASGFLAYFSLAWPWLNVWLQEVSLRVEEDPTLIYTVLKTVPLLLITLPILLLMLGCGVYMSWTAAKSPYLSIRFCAHLILIAFITIISFLCLYRTLRLLPLRFSNTLLLMYVIVGIIYFSLLYSNSSKSKETHTQPHNKTDN